ncbi:hypothetical protein ACQBAU_05370 [Propionibacteriaceae bacterium Y2011]
MTTPPPRRAAGSTGNRVLLGCGVGLVAIVVLAVVATVVVVNLLRGSGTVAPPRPRCVASIPDHSTVITSDQAWWTSIIVGTSVKRGLPPRAASIAMATVYQETDIRNLDHGDRDSVGLFQQRPSMGWGTVEQIMDPYYSSGAFYDVLVTIDGWQERDITEVAQAVQRSGYPEAYRDHETDGRTLASTFTGWTPAGLTCVHKADTAGDIDGLNTFLTTTLGIEAGVPDGKVITFTANSDEQAWAIAHTAMATGSRFGTDEVVVGAQRWQHDPGALSQWGPADSPGDDRVVIVTVA